MAVVYIVAIVIGLPAPRLAKPGEELN